MYICGWAVQLSLIPFFLTDESKQLFLHFEKGSFTEVI